MTHAVCSTKMSPASYRFLQRFVQRESGIVLDEDKLYLFEARLRPIVDREGLGSFDALCELLAGGRASPLAAQVTEAMTTNETLFFRDTNVFDMLRIHVFPARMAAIAGTRKLRIWSAAASTGQEAYSLAILLVQAGYSLKDVEIIGTDLSENVLDRARAGRYLQFEAGRGLPSDVLQTYFTRVGLDWQIDDEIRRMVRFERLDLRANLASLGRFDLVLCRNVLIYFDAGTKRQIVTSIARTLSPGGHLVLGCAESLIGMDEPFTRSTHGQSTLYSIR